MSSLGAKCVMLVFGFSILHSSYLLIAVPKRSKNDWLTKYNVLNNVKLSIESTKLTKTGSYNDNFASMQIYNCRQAILVLKANKVLRLL